eukprot:g11934.t1
MTATANAADGELPFASAARGGASGGGNGGPSRRPPFDGSLGGLKGGPVPNYRASDKWTILPQSEETGPGLMALKGGRADSELRKIRKEQRLRAPLQLPLFTSPLEADRAGDGKVHNRMSECLVAERDRFMELLSKERQDRVHREAFACSLIQAAYRGYLLRKRWAEVDTRQRIQLRVRKNFREFLKSKGAPFALGGVEKQQTEDRLRRAAACIIQGSFRCFLARQTLGKRRMASFLLKRRRAARTLQCWGRYLFALRRLRYMRMRALVMSRTKSAVAIQKQYRRHLGARITSHRRLVVHSIAASMIQGQWRLRKTLEGIQEVVRARLFRSAAAIQRIARGYVARKKVARQLIRVRALSRVRAVYTLQKFIRRTQAQRRVRRLRGRRRRGACARAALHVQRVCRGFVGRRQAAARKKAAKLDIWLAARQGNASQVDALYYGQGLGGVIFDCLNARDAEGNSLLAAVAGGAGLVSLVRVVLKWGADVNSVNHRGESALRLAMSKRNVEVVDLLVNHPDIRLKDDRQGKSLLHEAAALGLHHLAAQLVSKGLDVDAVDPENGWTPVHYACHNGRDELARLLTSRADAVTNIDLGGAGGATPLHLAAAGGWEKCATNLLENSASPVVKNDKGQVPAVVAMLRGHTSTAKALFKAFSAAKTAPKRSRAIDTMAAVAHAAGMAHASEMTTPAGAAATDNGTPSGAGGSRGIVKLAVAALAAANRSPAGASASGGAGEAAEKNPSLGGGMGLDEITVATPVGADQLAVPGSSGGDDGGGGIVGGVTGNSEERRGQDGGSQGSAGAGRDDGGGDASVASNASSIASSLAKLSRRTSEAGFAVDLEASTLEDLVPRCWDDDDIRCAISMAEKGEVWCLASLFALGLDPCCRDPDSGDTIGIAATRGGHRETLEVCLETGVPFAAKNNEGRSALHAAVVRGNLEVAALLLVNPGLSGLEVDDLCDQDAGGRTPLHEMAIRGEAPTVLLLATETDSEWTGSSVRSGGAGNGNISLGTSNCGDGGGSNASSSGSEGIKTGDHNGGSSDDVSSHGEEGGVGDRGGGGSARPLSSSFSTTAASLNLAVDAEAGAEHAAADTRPIDGAAGEEAGGCAPAPSVVRSPLPLSAFAAPSLADTKELRDHRRHQSRDAAGGSGDEGPPGGGAAKEGDVSAALAINVNGGDPRSSRSTSTTRSRGGRAASTVQEGNGRGSRKSVVDDQSAPNGAHGTDEADDDSDVKVSGGCSAADSARLGGSEEEDEVSGWGGLLDVNVRCAGSGNCPLHEAAASGSVGAVLSLLDLGADASIVNCNGDTALHVAVGPEAPRDYDDEGRQRFRSASSALASTSTSLPAAASILSPMSSSTLPIAGAVDTDGAGGEAPADAAVICDDEGRGPTTQVVTALLRRGADPTMKDGLGRTAAMCAVLAGRAGALRELRKAALLGPPRRKGREQQELSELSRVAISEGHVACLRVITEGCSEQDVLSWVDEEGVPALGLAVAHGQRECIDILLKGASPTSACGSRDDGNTVLHVTAMTRGGMPVLKRLMASKGGGEPFDLDWLEWRNGLGDTVLMAALRAGRHATALLLLQALAVPTAAAHTFRYAWVIAAALSSAELCPCPSCVLGRTAEERARLCSKVVSKPARPGELRAGASINSPSNAVASAAAKRRSTILAARNNNKVGFGGVKAMSRNNSRVN